VDAELTAASRIIYPEFIGSQSNIIYQLTLTGLEDGTTDLDLSGRLVSFSVRIRDGEPSFLGLVLSGVLDIIDDIEARTNGTLILSQGTIATGETEIQNLTEITRSNIDTITTDRGANSTTTQLRGYQTVNYDSPAQFTFTDVETENISGETIRIRSKLNTQVKPRDRILWNGLNILVDSMSYAVSVSNQSLDITGTITSE